MNDDSLCQQALNLIQASDTSSVLAVLDEVARFVHQLRPDLPPLDVNAAFLQHRKQFLHQQLEDLERTNPGLAGQLQQVIDKYCTRFPFDYE
jgi:hypothetical protein